MEFEDEGEFIVIDEEHADPSELDSVGVKQRQLRNTFIKPSLKVLRIHLKKIDIEKYGGSVLRSRYIAYSRRRQIKEQLRHIIRTSRNNCLSKHESPPKIIVTSERSDDSAISFQQSLVKATCINVSHDVSGDDKTFKKNRSRLVDEPFSSERVGGETKVVKRHHELQSPSSCNLKEKIASNRPTNGVQLQNRLATDNIESPIADSDGPVFKKMNKHEKHRNLKDNCTCAEKLKSESSISQQLARIDKSPTSIVISDTVCRKSPSCDALESVASMNQDTPSTGGLVSPIRSISTEFSQNRLSLVNETNIGELFEEPSPDKEITSTVATDETEKVIGNKSRKRHHSKECSDNVILYNDNGSHDVNTVEQVKGIKDPAYRNLLTESIKALQTELESVKDETPVVWAEEKCFQEEEIKGPSIKVRIADDAIVISDDYLKSLKPDFQFKSVLKVSEDYQDNCIRFKTKTRKKKHSREIRKCKKKYETEHKSKAVVEDNNNLLHSVRQIPPSMRAIESLQSTDLLNTQQQQIKLLEVKGDEFVSTSDGKESNCKNEIARKRSGVVLVNVCPTKSIKLSGEKDKLQLITRGSSVSEALGDWKEKVELAQTKYDDAVLCEVGILDEFASKVAGSIDASSDDDSNAGDEEIECSARTHVTLPMFREASVYAIPLTTCEAKRVLTSTLLNPSPENIDYQQTLLQTLHISSLLSAQHPLKKCCDAVHDKFQSMLGARSDIPLTPRKEKEILEILYQYNLELLQKTVSVRTTTSQESSTSGGSIQSVSTTSSQPISDNSSAVASVSSSCRNCIPAKCLSPSINGRLNTSVMQGSSGFTSISDALSSNVSNNTPTPVSVTTTQVSVSSTVSTSQSPHCVYVPNTVRSSLPLPCSSNQTWALDQTAQSHSLSSPPSFLSDNSRPSCQFPAVFNSAISRSPVVPLIDSRRFSANSPPNVLLHRSTPSCVGSLPHQNYLADSSCNVQRVREPFSDLFSAIPSTNHPPLPNQVQYTTSFPSTMSHVTSPLLTTSHLSASTSTSSFHKSSVSVDPKPASYLNATGNSVSPQFPFQYSGLQRHDIHTPMIPQNSGYTCRSNYVPTYYPPSDPPDLQPSVPRYSGHVNVSQKSSYTYPIPISHGISNSYMLQSSPLYNPSQSMPSQMPHHYPGLNVQPVANLSAPRCLMTSASTNYSLYFQTFTQCMNSSGPQSVTTTTQSEVLSALRRNIYTGHLLTKNSNHAINSVQSLHSRSNPMLTVTTAIQQSLATNSVSPITSSTHSRSNPMLTPVPVTTAIQQSLATDSVSPISTHSRSNPMLTPVPVTTAIQQSLATNSVSPISTHSRSNPMLTPVPVTTAIQQSLATNSVSPITSSTQSLHSRSNPMLTPVPVYKPFTSHAIGSSKTASSKSRLVDATNSTRRITNMMLESTKRLDNLVNHLSMVQQEQMTPGLLPLLEKKIPVSQSKGSTDKIVERSRTHVATAMKDAPAHTSARLDSSLNRLIDSLQTSHSTTNPAIVGDNTSITAKKFISTQSVDDKTSVATATASEKIANPLCNEPSQVHNVMTSKNANIHLPSKDIFNCPGASGIFSDTLATTIQPVSTGLGVPIISSSSSITDNSLSNESNANKVEDSTRRFQVTSVMENAPVCMSSSEDSPLNSLSNSYKKSHSTTNPAAIVGNNTLTTTLSPSSIARCSAEKVIPTQSVDNKPNVATSISASDKIVSSSSNEPSQVHNVSTSKNVSMHFPTKDTYSNLRQFNSSGKHSDASLPSTTTSCSTDLSTYAQSESYSNTSPKASAACKLINDTTYIATPLINTNDTSCIVLPSKLLLEANLQKQSLVLKWNLVSKDQHLQFGIEFYNILFAKLTDRSCFTVDGCCSAKWTSMGLIKAPTLPISATLSNLHPNQCYAFIVKGVFIGRKTNIYSDIQLLEYLIDK